MNEIKYIGADYNTTYRKIYFLYYIIPKTLV